MAIAIRATLTCSPVESSMSISRAGGRSVISLASAISSSVVCPAPRPPPAPARRDVRLDRPPRRGQDLVRVGDARPAEFLHKQRQRGPLPVSFLRML